VEIDVDVKWRNVGSGLALRWVDIEHRRLQPHRDLGIADLNGRPSLAYKATVGWQPERKGIVIQRHHAVLARRINEIRHRFIIHVDAADGLAVLVLQRGERPPLVDDDRAFGAGDVGSKQGNNGEERREGFHA